MAGGEGICVVCAVQARMWVGIISKWSCDLRIEHTFVVSSSSGSRALSNGDSLFLIHGPGGNANRLMLQISTGWAQNSSSTALLSNTTSYLRNLRNGSEIFLVGTAHVSRKSAEEVYDTIHSVKPDVIMVELCPERAAKLRDHGPSQDKKSTMKSMMDVFSSGMSSFMSGSGMKASFMDVIFKGFYKYLGSLGLEPGLEFKVAMEEAEKMGAKVVYGDLSGKETMKKIAETLSFSQIMQGFMGSNVKVSSPEFQKLFQNMTDIETIVEGMKRRAVVSEMNKCMEQMNPRMIQALVHERDQHMVNTLLKLEGRIVAVVGLAHLDGMEKRWEAGQSKGWITS